MSAMFYTSIYLFYVSIYLVFFLYQLCNHVASLRDGTSLESSKAIKFSIRGRGLYQDALMEVMVASGNEVVTLKKGSSVKEQE